MEIKDMSCPLTKLIMVDPVSTCDGQTYEREFIEEWLERNSTNPKTNLRLANKTLVPNILVKKYIQEYLAKNIKNLDLERVYLSKRVINQVKENILSKALSALNDKLNTLNDYRYFTKEIENGYSAFYLAAESSSLEMTQALFEYLFGKNLLNKIDRSPAGWKANNLIGLIKNYTIKDMPFSDLEKSKIKMLLTIDKHMKKINQFYYQDLLVSMRNYENFIWLFEKGQVSLEETDENGNTLLLKTAMKGKFEIFKYLLKRGAKIDTFNKQNENCFYHSLKTGYNSIFPLIVKVLMNQRCFDSDGIENEPRLHLAIIFYKDKPEFIQKIINLDKNMVNEVDFLKRTPLFLASEQNLKVIINILIMNGANVNHIDNYGKNCLHLAVLKPNEEILALLVDNYVNIYQLDLDEKTPLDFADRKTKNFLTNRYLEQSRRREMKLMERCKMLEEQIKEIMYAFNKDKDISPGTKRVK